MLCYLNIINNNKLINKNEILQLHFVCHNNKISTDILTPIQRYKCTKYTDFYSAIEHYNKENNPKLKIISTISKQINNKEYNFNQNEVYFYN